LRGGDSSKVDLLDLRKVTDTFEIWKRTITNNPAPVGYTLREISTLFPDDEYYFGVSAREIMHSAIDDFLSSEKVTDILVENTPDAGNANPISPDAIFIAQ
jgi:hypothetical protein